MRLHIEHNLEPDELVKSLSAIAEEEGIGEALMQYLTSHQDLHKGHSEGPDSDEPEVYMQELINEWKTVGKTLFNTCAQNVARWFAYKIPAIANEIKGLTKSIGGPPHTSLLLTQEDIEELTTLIQQHFTVSVVDIHLAPLRRSPWQITSAMQARWRQARIIAPAVNLVGLISDSWVAGRLHQVLEQGTTLSEMRNLAKQMPLTRAERIAVQVATESAAANMTNFGSSIANGVARRTADQNRTIAHDVIEQYTRGNLKVTRHTPHGLSELSPVEVASLETDIVVDDWKRLASELYHTFKEDPEEKGRDWHRVAVTESRHALNAGRVQSMGADGAIWLYYQVQPDACKYCKKLYLAADGITPKVFLVRDIMQNIRDTGGMNIGRKASKIGEPTGWVPNASTHPWCRCTPVRYLGGPILVAGPGGDAMEVRPTNIPMPPRIGRS